MKEISRLDIGHSEIVNHQPIIIGDRAWLCMRSVILKGSVIPDGCIVGANSLVTKQFCTSNTLLAGNPAREIKYNVQIYNEK